MDFTTPRAPRSQDGAGEDRPGTTGPDEVPIHLDLLRADLYRLLDELVRTRSGDQGDLVLEFERVWEELKRATAAGTG